MRFLISVYTGLGNCILKTPMVRSIRELWPDAAIDIIGGGCFGSEEVLDEELIHETHVLDARSSFIKKAVFFYLLKKRHYDAVFIAFDACPLFLVLGALLIGGKTFMHIDARVNRSLKRKIKNFLYSVGLPGFQRVSVKPGRHEIDLNYDLLEAFYGKPIERSYKTSISCREDSGVFDRFGLKDQPYIVFQPSAANGGPQAKVWAPENFVQLAEEIRRQYPGFKIVCVGDQGDWEVVKSSGLFELEGVMNTMGQTSIAELCTLIRKARVVVAHDSGIMHIADALDVDLIALYGPTDHSRTRPLGKKSRMVYSRNESFAAMQDSNVSEAELEKRYPGYYCMSGIRPEDVMAHINEMMNRKGNLTQ